MERDATYVVQNKYTVCHKDKRWQWREKVLPETEQRKHLWGQVGQSVEGGRAHGWQVAVD